MAMPPHLQKPFFGLLLRAVAWLLLCVNEICLLPHIYLFLMTILSWWLLSCAKQKNWV